MFSKYINLIDEKCSDEFELIQVQRGGISAIYKSRNGKYFLRIGDVVKIKKDLEKHKYIESFGFSISKIVSSGFQNDMQYFVEESLGEKTFAQIFVDDMKTSDFVSDKNFDLLLDQVVKFMKVQIGDIKDKNKTSFDEISFQDAIHLGDVCTEMPELKDKIVSKYKEVFNRLAVFPKSIMHGDFNPFNILPGGIIDFETVSVAPFGYDLIGFYTTYKWFPSGGDYEFTKLYKFSDKQIKKYKKEISDLCLKNSLPDIFEFQNEFEFLKGLWHSAGMSHVPKLQRFRFELLRKMLN